MIPRAVENDGGGLWPLGLLLSHLSGFFLPSRCVGCGTLRSGFGGGGACAACWSIVSRAEPRCPTCALPGDGASCVDCRTETPPTAAARAVGIYSGVLSRIVIAFKFHGYDILAEPAAALMRQAARDLPADTIVPVPSTRHRNRERGYDPALLLARGIGSRLGLRVEPFLRRARETVPQSTLPAPQRQANVMGAFSSSDRVRGRSVLLVDDVMTTGATAFSAARSLLEAGASRVDLVVLARTPEPKSPTKAQNRWTGAESEPLGRPSEHRLLENA
ncbi:MAG: ComF family protein [Thermoanaerobaculia bacterium]